MCGRNPAKAVSILTSQLLSLWTRYCGVTTWTVRRLFEDVQIVVFVFQLFVLHHPPNLYHFQVSSMFKGEQYRINYFVETWTKSQNCSAKGMQWWSQRFLGIACQTQGCTLAKNCVSFLFFVHIWYTPVC